MDKQQCIRCLEWYPATSEYFCASAHNRSGFDTRCKNCERERRHRECVENKERNRQYRIANRERIALYARNYRATYPDKVHQGVADWSRRNPLKVRAKQHRRDARLRHADGNHTEADILAQLKRQKKRCYYCGVKLKKEYHVDHVIPISRGGSNDPSNLVITCPHCNLSKSDKMPHEWAEGGRLL